MSSNNCGNQFSLFLSLISLCLSVSSLSLYIDFCFHGSKHLLIYCSDLKPPASTKTAVYQWDKTLQNLTKEIGKSCQYSAIKPLTRHLMIRV